MPPESHAQKILEELRGQANDCHACPLWRDATQTVFGEGQAHAAMMLVGEQPGDREDRDGRPFVGPAGALLDRALAQAVIDRAQVYVTNAGKHFKYRSRGKRRIHQRPDSEEIKPAINGSRQSWSSSRRAYSFAWARQQRKRCSEGHRTSNATEATRFPLNSHPWSCLQPTHQRYCSSAITTPGKPRHRRSSEICELPGESAPSEMGARIPLGIRRSAAGRRRTL